MTVIAGVSSIVLFGKLQGVREGTIVAALLVGFIARFLGRQLSFLPDLIYGSCETTEQSEQEADAAQLYCIVIGRQYGSGGHDYGKHLAEKFGMEFYDREIIEMISGVVGLEPEYISKREESMSNSLLYDLVNQVYSYSAESEAPKDAIFEAEMHAIQKLAKKGNCVIVGRCADYILKQNKNCLRLFLHAPLEERIKRICSKREITEEEARREIHNTDRRRADNYRYYTRQVWGLSSNYHLSMDTSLGESFMDELVEKSLGLLRTQHL
jgi:cytidylate kinase